MFFSAFNVRVWKMQNYKFKQKVWSKRWQRKAKWLIILHSVRRGWQEARTHKRERYRGINKHGWHKSPDHVKTKKCSKHLVRLFHYLSIIAFIKGKVKNVFLCNGIRWPLFSYLHHNSQSFVIIFVNWTQL